jgi:hypothetical protein
MVQMFQLGAHSTTPSASIEGTFPQQQFGFSVAISESLVFVGSPGFTLNTSTFVGKLDSFDFPLASAHAVWSRTGDQPFARFGLSVSVAPLSDSSPPIVAVGQPHRKCAMFFCCASTTMFLQCFSQHPIRTDLDGGNHGGAVTLLVGHRDRSLGLRRPQSDLKFDCKTSVSGTRRRSKLLVSFA